MYFHTGHFAFTVTNFLLTYHSLLHNTETPTSSSSPAVKSLSDGAALCLRGLLASPEKHLAAIVDCSGTRILDCGVEVQGTAELGVIMADVAMGGRCQSFYCLFFVTLVGTVSRSMHVEPPGVEDSHSVVHR